VLTMKTILWSGVLACALGIGGPAYSAEEQPSDGLSCSQGEEREGSICYAECKGDGYTRYEGDGEMCMQICPSNSQDFGHVCLTGPAQLKKKMYKRGPGRPIS
jgi:hypothetical protein